MEHRSKTFKNERVELGGQTFHDCTFDHCELVFNGDRSPTFKDNRFVDSVFVFVGSATRTLYFLSNVYHAGDGGREVIEHMFSDLRQREFHGGEIKTIAPHTVDHSLG